VVFVLSPNFVEFASDIAARLEAEGEKRAKSTQEPAPEEVSLDMSAIRAVVIGWIMRDCLRDTHVDFQAIR